MACTTTFLELPAEIHLLICEYLDPASAVALKSASKYLRSIITVDMDELELEYWEVFYITLEMRPERVPLNHNECLSDIDAPRRSNDWKVSQELPSSSLELLHLLWDKERGPCPIVDPS
ncbi:hypothetical protein KXV64_002159 [Aspergillus fumigatus]|nr:hypothetical protein KXX42_005263 [Aspergillus fumigatus]KAH1983929.1 hypothetical protein KXW88_002706 [Aspergillus fumigatus]KAH2917561.1 hypothetical protein KXW25_007004 [Aspergillus fumigatus]KAH3017350.1 hypothetical protein KXW60_007151 [Aspergillus fumigatus]KAH3203919.1 hypothetical protein KXW62_006871 [Aspergillus fumigatus]